MLTDEQKKNILRKFLKNISHISDKNYQRRIWIRGEGPEWDSFDDACCRFFNDGASVFENYKDFWITESQYQILKIFWDKFDIFADDNDWPEDFIDTPEWNEITNMAAEVLQSFNYKDGDNIR